MTCSSRNISRIFSRYIYTTFRTHYHNVSHHQVVWKNTYTSSSQKMLYSYLPVIQKESLSNRGKETYLQKIKIFSEGLYHTTWEPCTKCNQCCFYFTLMWSQYCAWLQGIKKDGVRATSREF